MVPVTYLYSSHQAVPYPTSTFKLAISGEEEVAFEYLNGITIVPDTIGEYRVFSWGSEGGVLELNGVNILRADKKRCW